MLLEVLFLWSSIPSSIHGIWPCLGRERIIQYKTCLKQRRLIQPGSKPRTRSHPIAHIATSLFFEVVPTAAIYSKAIAHVVNFYLHDDRKEAREDIVQLSALRTPEADAKVQGYVHEALSKYIFPFISYIVE